MALASPVWCSGIRQASYAWVKCGPEIWPGSAGKGAYSRDVNALNPDSVLQDDLQMLRLVQHGGVQLGHQGHRHVCAAELPCHILSPALPHLQTEDFQASAMVAMHLIAGLTAPAYGTDISQLRCYWYQDAIECAGEAACLRRDTVALVLCCIYSVDRTAHGMMQAAKKPAALASMSGSACSASFENLKPQVNSSPQNRTCRRSGALLPITSCRVVVLLRVSSALQLASMRKHAPISLPC